MRTLALILCTSAAAIVQAQVEPREKGVLYFDHTPHLKGDLRFEQRKPLLPRVNSFTIVHTSFLSDGQGERWALITFKNTDSGQRILKDEYVVATFASGEQVNAQGLTGGELSLDPGAELTRAVFFGVSAFPIVRIQTQP